MFCPKCSQQQISGEVRFCSRCGFQLGAVCELLKTDGMSLTHRPDASRERLPLIQRKELRSGAKVIFLSAFLMIPFFALSIIFDSAFPLVIPLITFAVGLAQMLYFFIFGESILPLKKQNQLTSDENEQRLNFQPAQGLPFSVIEQKPLNTAEFAQPYSVTERTTNLLEKE